LLYVLCIYNATMVPRTAAKPDEGLGDPVPEGVLMMDGESVEFIIGGGGGRGVPGLLGAVEGGAGGPGVGAEGGGGEDGLPLGAGTDDMPGMTTVVDVPDGAGGVGAVLGAVAVELAPGVAPLILSAPAVMVTATMTSLTALIWVVMTVEMTSPAVDSEMVTEQAAVLWGKSTKHLASLILR
jgi:hypothetical protein